ncbi:outer membrane efflux protein [Salinisphaera sp. T31B1]
MAVVILGGCAVSPEPLDRGEVLDRSRDNMMQLDDHEPPLSGELTPDKAIARALMYNLDRRVKAMQAALARGELSAANYDMLPSLTAQAGYTTRSQYAATESVPFVGGEPLDNLGPSQYSVGQEKSRYTYGIDFSWSVLDFGLSYVRAKQQANQYLISVEDERKVMHNLAQEVRTAYWKTVSANRLLGKIDPLMKRVDDALANSREISRNRLSDPLNNFSFERSLLDVKRSLESLRSELVGARETLASLMGLPPTTPLNLPDYDSGDFPAAEPRLDMDTMEQTALIMRPEIRTADYRERIARDDVKAAFLQMFPDLSLTAGYQHDSNDFLRYQDWTSAGAAVSYDLLNVFKVNAKRNAAKMSVDVARQQRLAASLAVLTQVHLAALQYQASQDTLDTAEQYLGVSRNISELVDRQSSAGGVGQLTVIKEQLNALVAELRRDLAYARIQNATARVYQSIGLDLYPTTPSQTPAEFAARIGDRKQAWEDGGIAVVVTPIAEQEPVLKTRAPGQAPSFTFAGDTFALAGARHYRFSTDQGSGLPSWLDFDPATRTFTVNEPAAARPVTVRMHIENDKGIYANDRFVLRPGWQNS